jgi:hypothetical protein
MPTSAWSFDRTGAMEQWQSSEAAVSPSLAVKAASAGFADPRARAVAL